jgi:ADP-heptose:LPS heptosyltransferase
VNNPRIAKGDEPHVWVQQYPGHRPYLSRITGERLYFNDNFKVKPGELYLTEGELKEADRLLRMNKIKKFILVEPNVKGKFVHAVNKAWPHFKKLIKHDLPWLQVGDSKAQRYTRFIQTKSFRQACAILSRAEMFVGTDGGLHHAAAALGIPAVVIWTGFTSPKHLGYDEHINIHDGGEPCGTINKVCPHCLEIAKNITVERVLDAIHTIRCRT